MSNGKNEHAPVDMDSLLDGSLDDLDDLPTFKPFPNGAHLCTIGFERKIVNKHPCFEVKLTYIEAQELANKEEAPPEKGDEATVLYMMDNEVGQGKFKELMKVFAAHHGAMKLGELVAASQNNQVLAVTEQRDDKEKTKKYMDITNIRVV